MRGEQVELPSELERKQARNSGKFNEAVDMIDGPAAKAARHEGG